MTEIEEAILRTVLYADVFHFPMTVREIHHFLIADSPVPFEYVEHALATSAFLRQSLATDGSYIACAGREELFSQRIKRETISAKLWQEAQFYGKWLARIPFVRMVALTGALAMRNAAHEADDLDYVLVTTDQRVWIARAFAILLVRVARLRGVTLCPNYVLAQSVLEQNQRDLFIAHEVTQMVPLYGQSLYQKMRAVNGWSADYLPNADGAFHVEAEHAVTGLWAVAKSALEGLLRGAFGNRLEQWEYRRKQRRFAAEMARKAHHAAQIDAQRVKGHFDDHGHPVLRQYDERLRQHQLDALPIAGD